MGRAGREEVILHWSVERMVSGYEELLSEIYAGKAASRRGRKGLGMGDGEAEKAPTFAAKP